MIKEIYLAGGCFWGLEKFLKNIDGVVDTRVGYANGRTENPTYQEVCKNNTGHAETVKVVYDNTAISLRYLLENFFTVIDPTLLNRQGNDVGTQYRTGIYFVDEEDKKIIAEVLDYVATFYEEKIVTEILKLENFYLAEEYHQDYLNKNPQGYCHIDLESFQRAKEIIVDPYLYVNNFNKDLSEEQKKIAFESYTERPFTNEYWDYFSDGIYVDIVSGEPLFSSKDKFKCGCGWASFSKPIDKNVIKYYEDSSHGMNRVEVKARVSDIHLGHVFEDGPKDSGGLRYCINGSVLKFISIDKMEDLGYKKYIKYVR